MKKEELTRLLERYYKGESTEKEEKLLISFFNGVDVPEGYDAEKAIFSYYSSYSDIPGPSADFEARILSGIDEYEEIHIPGKTRNLALLLLSGAAGILIMVGSYFFFADKDELQDTFNDPEIAYAETMRILMSVSSDLNKGTRALEPFNKINVVKSKSIDKNLKNLEYIQTALKLSSVPTYKK